jgi:type I restriction-modification system DNA methylase subunit
MISKEEIISRLNAIMESYHKNYSDDALSEDDTRSKLIDRILREVLEWEEPLIDRQKPIETESSIKRADYSYPKPVPKVIIEAKKLKSDNNLANGKYDKQVQDYAYSKAVNWAILTDFKRIRGWYVTRDRIYPFCDIDLFSGNLSYIADKLQLLNSQNILDGSLDEYAKVSNYRVQEIDITTDLANSINKFRARINRHFRDELKDTTPEQIEELIQGLINRLIFIKKVESEELEERTLEQIYRKMGKDIYNEIKTVFGRYRQKYDTDIFGTPESKPAVERIDIPDRVISELLTIISKPSEHIEYNFAAIDVDVLGNIYENYLAYIQKGRNLTGGKSKRKEQGIYYTPKPIVDYIVENTVSKSFRRQKSDGSTSKIKVLDPACGSGSFLIKAVSEFDLFYSDKIKNYNQLSPSKRLELIKNNIYGVDLDERAVSIAKLNIYLKILSSTKQKTITDHTTLLPELKSNIKVGNSIIDNEQISSEPFDWNGWLDGLDTKGFDIIVGNPPYGAKLNDKERDFIRENYPATQNNTDTAIAFMNKAYLLLNKDGYLGFIVPKPLIYSQKWIGARALIRNDLIKLVDVSKAFKDVLLEQVIIILKKGSNTKDYQIEFLDKMRPSIKIDKALIETFGNLINDVTEDELKLGLKLVGKGEFLSKIATIERGAIIQNYLKESGAIPILRGKDIARYEIKSSKDFISQEDYNKLKNEIAYMERPKVVIQNIVAHVMKPKDHIIMMATIDEKGLVTLDNVGNIFVDGVAPEFIVGLLNSKLINWYAYRFIYAKAIRTMRFDKYHLAKLPLCAYQGKQEYDKIVRLVKEIMGINGELKKSDALKDEVNRLVYKLYNLDRDQIKLVEENSW